MSDRHSKPSSGSSLNYPLVTVIAVLVLAALGGAGLFFSKGKSDEQTAQPQASSIEAPQSTAQTDQNPLSGETFPPMPQAADYAPAAGEDSASNPPVPSDDVAFSKERMEEILGLRAVGDPAAPIKIEEFSSLTCPHCAGFHEKIYDELKAKYIDTGKVYFIFRDFPLNKPALDASITARCLPEDKYEAFLTLLFKTQRQWATEGYIKALEQNAKLAGLSGEDFEFCQKNETIRNEIAQTRQSLGEKYKIESTPTFIFNDGAEAIKGTASLAAFEQVIEKLLAAPAQ